jgi:hypothetical protein
MKVINALNARPSWRGERPGAIDDRPRAVWVMESPPIPSGPAPLPILPWFYPRRAGRCPMSTMTKVRSRITGHSKASSHAPNAAAGQARISSNLRSIPKEDEPKEDSARVTEAPESWQERREAPDSGRGVSHTMIESDYTHGRSRS